MLHKSITSHKYRKKDGFALPAVIVLSFVALITVLSFMQSLTVQGNYNKESYYAKLAAEAAESGLDYALLCMSKNANYPIWRVWYDTRVLTEKTNCNGYEAPATGAPASDHAVLKPTEGPNIRTRFTVEDPILINSESVTLEAIGYTELLDGSGNVTQTFESRQRKFVNWGSRSSISYILSAASRSCYIQFYKVYCWGDKRGGLLGTGEVIPATASTSLANIQMEPRLTDPTSGLFNKDAIQIAAGEAHTCALTSDGEVWCWGLGWQGQLGVSPRGYYYSPVRVQFPQSDIVAREIGASNSATCAIVDKTTSAGGSGPYSNKIMCWGSQLWGATGSGTAITNVSSPSYVQAQTTPALIQTGWGFRDLPDWYRAERLVKGTNASRTMCATVYRDLITTQRQMYCWGQNRPSSASGISMMGISSTSTHFSRPYWSRDSSYLRNGDIYEITIGGESDDPAVYAHGCALLAYSISATSPDGIACWGGGLQGQLGNTRQANVTVPTQYDDLVDHYWAWPFGTHPVDVQAGRAHTCALLTNGEVYCWGLQSTSGMIGSGTTQTRYLYPYRVQGDLAGKNTTLIAAGENRSCAVGATFAYCWGINNANQIGDGFACDPPVTGCNTYNRLSPTRSKYLEAPVEQYLF